MSLFHGLSAFPITPTDPHGKVDSKALENLLDRLKDANVHSVGLLGSTGGYVYLSRSERRRAIEIAVHCLGGRIPIIASVGALRTDEAQNLAQDAQAAGADALLLAPVSYTPLIEDEVYEHFVAVADATDLPLCIYNNPGTTHFTFSTSLLQRLASVPHITAVKMPLPASRSLSEDLGDLRSKLPHDFAIGYSGDWGCAEALLSGADAWYSVIGGLFPVQTLKLMHAAQANDKAEAMRIDNAFQPLWKLFKEFGSIRVIYVAANILSLTDAAPPRPILPLPLLHWDRVALALESLDALS